METMLTRRGERTRPKAIDFSKSRSKTKQSFKAEADINNIMQKYTKTGVLPSGTRQPKYGDFSNGEDLRSVMDRVISAEMDFNQLPSDLRNRFGNKAANLLDFLADPANETEAQELGLLPQGEVAAPEGNPAPEPVPDPVVDPE